MKPSEIQDEKTLRVIAQFNAARAGANVRRYHTKRLLVDDTVGQHSHGVAVLLDMMHGGNCGAALLRAALYHDVAESYFGDIPSPAKRAFDSEVLRNAEDAFMKQVGCFTHLNEWERFKLKFCDILEGLTFCCEEYERGNRQIIDVWNNYWSYARQKLEEIEKFQQTHEAEVDMVSTFVGNVFGILQAKMENARS